MAASNPSMNPIVKLAVLGAGVAGSFVANQVLEKGWSAVFGETAPSDKAVKQGAKEAKTERKEAKKDGASKAKLSDISNSMDDVPVWKLLLWTVVSGVVIQGIRLLAERGAQKGAARLVERRPRSNRG